MGGGEIVGGGDFRQGFGKRSAHSVMERTGAGEQPGAGDGREWHRHLQLGIIVAARTLECVRPAVVEDIFPARMGLHVTGRGTMQSASGVL